MTGLRCSIGSAAVGESLAGTAPEARGWLVVEQSGPWGRQALTDSHLDHEIGTALAAHAAGTGVTVLLIRRPGRHADDHHTPERRTAWLACTLPGRSWLRRLDIGDPRELLTLDLRAVAAGTEPDVGVRDEVPLLLVCTNSKRDQCCAIEGRPVAHEAVLAHPGRVWECNHLGGHRFAPTALVLPSGFVHGRLDADRAPRLLDDEADGLVELSTLRGRSCWPPQAQAAEVAVRTTHDLHGVDDIVDAAAVRDDVDPELWHASVTCRDGSRHERLVRSVVDDDVLRAESCVKPPVPLRQWTVVDAPGTR